MYQLGQRLFGGALIGVAVGAASGFVLSKWGASGSNLVGKGAAVGTGTGLMIGLAAGLLSKAPAALPGAKTAGPVTINLVTPPQGLFPIVPGSVVTFNLPAGASWPSTGWASEGGNLIALQAGSPLTYQSGAGALTLNWIAADGVTQQSATISFVDA